jgi:hypothetical protein
MPAIEQLKTEYIRNDQPHFQPIGATFAVTIMAHDAIPEALLNRVRKRRQEVLLQIDRDNLPQKAARKREIQDRYFQYIEKLLHLKSEQEHPFRNPAIGTALENRIKEYAGKYYDLVAYSIMSNHAHLQIDFSIQCSGVQGKTEAEALGEYVNLATVLGKIKGGSTYDANKVTGRKGTLWKRGYYDRYMRSQSHLMTEFWYILRNPEKAGLVENWRNHPYTYGDPNLLGDSFSSF